MHGMADSMPTPNLERSHHMQPLYPSFCFGDDGFSDPSMRKKALAMRGLKLRSCMIVLGRRNLTAKFDGGISGEKLRRSRRRSTRRKMRRSFGEILLDQKSLLENFRNSTANSTATQNRVAKTCRQGMFS